MTKPRRKVTRRAALAGMGGLALAAQAGGLPGEAAAQEPTGTPAAVIPVRGKAGPGLEAFDQGMFAITDRHGIPGAALAMAKTGKLVLARGYGSANTVAEDPIRPQTLFGLASLSKPITAVAALLLVEEGKLGLDDRVFDILRHITP